MFISPALGIELGVQPGDVLLTRLQKPSEIPIESLFAHKEDLGRTVRLTVTGTLRPAELGEFSLQPQQAEVRAVFAPLRRLQRDLGVERKVNTVLIGESTSEADGSRAFRSGVTLEDLGVEVSVVAGGTAVIVESASGVIGEALERAGREAARELNHAPVPVFTHLANAIRVAIAKSRMLAGQWHQSSRVVHLRAAPPTRPLRRITPGRWTSANPEGAVAGFDRVERVDRSRAERQAWRHRTAGLLSLGCRGRLENGFRTVHGRGNRSDGGARRRPPPRPGYPGITEAESFSDWDPPFPLDLSRVRPQDEAYWKEYRTTPKAFLFYERARISGQRATGRSRVFFDGATRAGSGGAGGGAAETALQQRVTRSPGPDSDARRRLALDASRGATDFGEYFTYFSFFIVVAALLLVVLFFRLGIEQRLRQIGVLRATGYTGRDSLDALV